MKKFTFLLLCVLILSSCAPTAPQAAATLPPPPLPPPTASPTPEPTATAIPVIELNVDADTKTVIDAQKAPYAVNESGQAVITVDGKEITLLNIADTRTDFGLAEDIINGSDQDGVRYLFTEKGGWAKVIEAGTPENRTTINYADFASGLVNKSAALLYQDNPTIPDGAIDPQWWLKAGGNSAGRIINLSLMPNDGTKDIRFDGKTKPYGDITLWLEYTKNGVSFVTDVRPNKNPDKINRKPDQKIFLNWTFDKDRYSQKGDNIDNIHDDIINNRMSLTALLVPGASRPTSVYTYGSLAGPDGIFSTPNLLTPGSQIALFTSSEQEMVENGLLIIDSGNRIPESQRDVEVSVIPQKFALQPLIGNFEHFPWGHFEP